MKRMLKKFICIGVLAVSGCGLIPLELNEEKPKAPPTLNKTLFVNGISRQNVLDYQHAITNYIKYLEQYYISIGVYYGGNITLPSKAKQEACRVIEDIFKDIKLPPPPKPKSKEIEKTFDLLIDHITELRRLIRNNNFYMESLRERYKKCK